MISLTGADRANCQLARDSDRHLIKSLTLFVLHRICLHAVVLVGRRQLLHLLRALLPGLHDLDAVGLGGALLGQHEVLGLADPLHVPGI